MIYPLILSSPSLQLRAEEDFSKGQIEVIVKFHGDLNAIANRLNAAAERLNDNYAILTLPVQSIPELYRIPEVEYFELPKTMSYLLQNSLSRVCISPVQQKTSFGLSGKDVLVGIIDSGIDYTNPDFRNPDGSSRILYLWDQTLTGTPPTGFRSGALYTKEDLDRALKSDQPYADVPSQDLVGHGTAIAGIIASNGRGSGSMRSGAAPEVGLVIVKLGSADRPGFSRSTEIMRAVKFVIDTARDLGMPIAVNISYGTNEGAHDGNSLFERYLDSEAGRWKNVLCVAVGNEGSSGHHYRGTAKQGETQQVDFAIGGGVSRLYLSLWKNFTDNVEYELVGPSGRSTGSIASTQSVTTATIDGTRVTVLYGQPNHYSTSQEVYFALRGVSGTIPQGVWNLKVQGERIVSGLYDIWMPLTDAVTRETFFLNPDPENTITIPATAQSVISVGGYNALLGSIADFSGRGEPYGVYGQKPDLVAPAVGIMTSKVGGGYDTFSGTSVAAPFVTGAAALMMQWGIVQGNDIFLYGQRVKAFLWQSASRESPGPYPNTEWGYGILNLCGTMNQLVAYNQAGGAFS